MKKLYTLILMLGMFLIPQITLNAALTPPAEYDYSYLWNGTTFEFSDGTNTFIPEYTQTANSSGGFDYEYVGDMGGLAPFEITLFFARSTSSWTTGTTGHIPNESIIGSNYTIGSLEKKYYIKFNNFDAYDYSLIKDISSSSSVADHAYYMIYNGNFTYTYNYETPTLPIRSRTTALNQFIIPGGSSLEVYNTTYGNRNLYVDALYIKQLGLTPIIENSYIYNAGFTEGFGDGYQAGVEEDNAYALGYAKGLSEGQDMETGSSIIVLVLVLMAFVMMLFGFTSRRRIFNLFASGLFIVLGGILVEYAAFVIVAVGLVIVNVYYTFVSE